jgi:hypothetical protein
MEVAPFRGENGINRLGGHIADVRVATGEGARRMGILLARLKYKSRVKHLRFAEKTADRKEY